MRSSCAGWPCLPAALDELEAELQDELDEAKRWFQDVVVAERNWILEEANVEAAFAETYYRAPESSYPKENPVWLWIMGGLALAALGLRWRHRRRLAKAQAREREVVGD